MSEPRYTSDELIDALAADLKPMARLAPPWLSASVWVALLGLAALALAPFADLRSIGIRLSGEPDMSLAVAGSVLTAVLAAFSAFQLNSPDRSLAWTLLPLPGLVLWVSASGLGCARTWLAPMPEGAFADEMRHCLMFIIAVSVPLSALMFAMLRRGYSMYPRLTGGMAGLAVASGAASLLNFFHPFDAAIDDLLVHAAAVSIVVAADRFLGVAILPGASRRLPATPRS